MEQMSQFTEEEKIKIMVGLKCSKPSIQHQENYHPFGSRIDYCNSLLIEISEQNLDRLQRVQSKADRIVCNAGRQVTSSGNLVTCLSPN